MCKNLQQQPWGLFKSLFRVRGFRALWTDETTKSLMSAITSEGPYYSHLDYSPSDSEPKYLRSVVIQSFNSFSHPSFYSFLLSPSLFHFGVFRACSLRHEERFPQSPWDIKVVQEGETSELCSKISWIEVIFRNERNDSRHWCEKLGIYDYSKTVQFSAWS